MKMLSARLKMLTLSVYCSICDDYGVETGFIRQILLSMDILLRQRKDLHQMTLHNGKLHIPKASQEIALNK